MSRKKHSITSSVTEIPSILVNGWGFGSGVCARVCDEDGEGGVVCRFKPFLNGKTSEAMSR